MVPIYCTCRFTDAYHTQVVLVTVLTMYTGMVNANASTSACTHNITVSSNGTTNTSDCLYKEQDACSKLSDALSAIISFKNNVCIYILSDVALSEPVTLENVASIVLSGANEQVIVSCIEQGGLSFLNSSNIFISNLIFENCSTNRTSTSFNSTNPVPLTMYTALYFSGCIDTTYYTE